MSGAREGLLRCKGDSWEKGRGLLGTWIFSPLPSGLDPTGQAPPAMVSRRWMCS